jgi:hypothetical protein
MTDMKEQGNTMHDADDEGLARMIHDAGAEYRRAPEPRVDLMWREIETRAFAPGRRIAWNIPLALAAVLALGLGVGYWAGQRATSTPSPASEEEVNPDTQAQLTSATSTPFVGVASNYLEQMTGLLIAVAGDLQTGQVPAGTITNARELLSTTRLLLDSGVEDPRFRDLLEDLELVLAQVVRLRDASPAMDAALIAQALDQREVLPRLASYLNASVVQ